MEEKEKKLVGDQGRVMTIEDKEDESWKGNVINVARILHFDYFRLEFLLFCIRIRQKVPRCTYQ